MAIAKKPQPKLLATDAHAEKFIAGANAKEPVAPATEPAPEVEQGRIPTMIRFDAALLAKVDAAAKRRGVSRSAWVQYTLSEALEEQG